MKQKLIISFVATMLLLSVLGFFSISKMIELSSLTQKLYDHPLQVTNSTKTIQTNIISMHRYMKDVVLAKNIDQLNIALINVNISEQIVYDEFDKVFAKYLGNKDDIQTSYDAFVNWTPIREKIIELCVNGMTVEAANITKDRGAKYVKMLNIQISKLITYAQNKADYFLSNSIQTKKEAIFLTSIILISILIILIFILIILIRKLAKSQNEIKKQSSMLLHQSRFAQMGEMISMIAHQWRQPLASISSVSIDLQVNMQLHTYDLETQEGRHDFEKYFSTSLTTVDTLVKSLTNTIDDFRNFYKSNKQSDLTIVKFPIIKALDIIRSSLKANNNSY